MTPTTFCAVITTPAPSPHGYAPATLPACLRTRYCATHVYRHATQIMDGWLLDATGRLYCRLCLCSAVCCRHMAAPRLVDRTAIRLTKGYHRRLLLDLVFLLWPLTDLHTAHAAHLRCAYTQSCAIPHAPMPPPTPYLTTTCLPPWSPPYLLFYCNMCPSLIPPCLPPVPLNSPTM